MASYGHHAMSAPGSRPGPSTAYGPMQMVPPTAPQGTFSPGTKIQVGNHRVVIQKYLSEGGFAHVYLVKLPSAVNGTDLAVLKRVAVPDKEALRGMRTEVETMKRLKGHNAIVTYMDSHASELKGGGYEVFLLMEYCNGGGLIDFMNTRLQHRLTEPEILNIFSDVAEGVACMHYLKPPLLHRDLKVENVLITKTGAHKKFKLCDFGSAAPPKAAPVSVVECRLMDEDVQRHTTLQYRSPEMVDVYRKQPIDEKSDIWALGVLLYKLCYYTTPFEDQGQLAILNASYRFPSHPVFSDRLKKLIASMLRENQQSRPNIYQVLRESCAMQGKEIPIKDIYSRRSRSEPRGNDKAPVTEKPTTTPVVGAVFSPPRKQQQAIPEVVPMRRGRPPGAAQPSQGQPVKPSSSPRKVTNGDPFAALDSGSGKPAKVDDLSSRFPTLDQFSLLHEKGAAFTFDEPAGAPQAQTAKEHIQQKVAERLADDAFATSPSKQPLPRRSQPSLYETAGSRQAVSAPEKQITSPPAKSASAPPKQSEMSRASAIISSTPELQAISSQASKLHQGTGSKPKMVSTGTMTSTPPLERQQPAPYQIYRFPPPDQQRSSSLPRQPDVSSAKQGRKESSSPSRVGDASRLGPVQSLPAPVGRSSSSRPSLEESRPATELLEPSSKPTSETRRPRPVSAHLESSMDYHREKEVTHRPLLSPGHPSPKFAERKASPRLEPQQETGIESNAEFLRSMEDSEARKDRSLPKHGKRSSLTSLSGTKNILAGKFGDAFKRFEGNASGPPPPRTPSPLKQLERQDLTPIAGSEPADDASDNELALVETDDMNPEQRREIERRRLSMEEKRVAAAAAEYRQRVSSRTAANPVPSPSAKPAVLPRAIGGVSRAASIQNRVQSLLSDSQASTTVQRTAEGYGHFADSATAASRPIDGQTEIPRKPVATNSMPGPFLRTAASSASAGSPAHHSANINSDPARASSSRPSATGAAPRPLAKPKPIHLNKNASAGGVTKPASPTRPSGANKALPRPPGQLVAVDLLGQPALDMSLQDKEDYIRDFSKRYPSLTSIEMVERDLAAEADEQTR